MIERILPPCVTVAEEFSDDSAGLLPSQQNPAVLSSIGRQIKHGNTFACADVALERLTTPPNLPYWATDATPQWPDGMIGSIADCVGYRAAAVALTRDVVALAIDVQPNQPLPDDGLLELLAYDEEHQRLADLALSMPAICWDRLLFSAKLAVYKAWFPSAKWWVNFELVDINIDEYGQTFIASLLLPGPTVNGKPLTEMRGQWMTIDGFAATGVVVPAPRT